MQSRQKSGTAGPRANKKKAWEIDEDFVIDPSKLIKGLNKKPKNQFA